MSDDYIKLRNKLKKNFQQLKKDLTWSPLPNIDINNLQERPIDKTLLSELALNLTPIGGLAGMTKKVNSSDLLDFFGKHKVTELGDVTLTRSAKDPSMYQLTAFDGPLGKSNPIRDEQISSLEEAMKLFESYK